MNQTIKAWIASMDTQERNRLVDALFGLLGTGGIDKALDIFHPRNIRTYIKTLGNDPETRQILSAEFQNLMEAAKRTRMQPGDANIAVTKSALGKNQGGFCYASPMRTG